MTLKYGDRVKESSTTTGTGSYTLDGAVSAAYVSFATGVSVGNTTYYLATNGVDWEGGKGTLSDAMTLTRDTIVASSNAGAAVNWGAGTKILICTPPAEAMPVVDTDGTMYATGNIQLDDNEAVEFGDLQDYTVKWDGSDAVHTVSAGSFSFVGGNVDVSGKIALDGTVVAYRPTAMTGTLILGDGGASLSHTTGSEGYYNTFVGLGAGYNNTTGYQNTASGTYALYSNTAGNYNTASGYAALYANTTGNYNTASGYRALRYNTTGNYNTASGYRALYYNTGTYNTASGTYALYSNTAGTYNTASGYAALYSNTAGNYNTASGYTALYANTTGSQNTASGMSALYDATNGTYNTALGYNTGRGITTGDYNTIVGAQVTGLAADLQNTVIIADGAGSQRIVVDSSGNVQIPADNAELQLGAAQDYTITWDGTDAVHTVSAGDFVFSGGNVRVGGFDLYNIIPNVEAENIGVNSLYFGSATYKTGNITAPTNNEIQINAAATHNGDTCVTFYTTNAWSNAERVRVTNSGDVEIGTTTVPTANSGKVLVFGDNAADPTMGINTAGIYGKDVSGTVEMFAVDEAGNATQLSPHNPETGEWEYYSHNTRTGVTKRVNMERVIALLEQLIGKPLMETCME